MQDLSLAIIKMDMVRTNHAQRIKYEKQIGVNMVHLKKSG